MISLIFVVQSISRDGGGVSEAVKHLAILLNENPNISVEVVTLRDKNFDKDISELHGVKVSAYRFFGPARYGFSPGLLMHVLRSSANVAHVHGIWMFHCFAVLCWSLLRNKPYVITPHGMMERWILNRSPKLKSIVSALYQTAFLRRASIFHILTEKEKFDVDSMVSGKASVVIPNYLPPVALANGMPNWWSADFCKKKIYLFFGRIHSKKGWRELCDAWSNLCRIDDGFASRSQLIFCGWVDGSSDFLGTIDSLQSIYKNVLFAGPQFGLDKLTSLQAASVFILPSKSEGLPMVVLEAWAAGVPVLMTAACNLRIGFERNAAIEIGESSQSIMKGLRIADGWSSETTQAMSIAGKKLIDQEFSSGSMTEKFLQLYELALVGNRRS